MLSLGQKPWAKAIAWLVIGLTALGCAFYAYSVKLTRSLDWGERAILKPSSHGHSPNAAIIRRHGAGVRR